MKKILLISGLAAIQFNLSTQMVRAETAHWPKPLAEYAPDAPSCTAIYSQTSDQYFISNLEQCQERLSPCSTFKIPNTLIGLETGILSGPDHVKRWDGTTHSRKVLNGDHDLASAIKYSVVWYFQEVAIEVGPLRMQASLDAFNYGNRDISGGQNQFWLSSTLKISALEQIRFMAALDREELPISERNQKAVKAMMLQDYSLPDGFEGELFGKTGSCIGPEGVDHGWFTGFLHRDGRKYVFAVNIKGKEQWVWQARTLAIKVLQDLR